MNANRIKHVLGLSFTFAAVTVGFQNCGQFSTTTQSSQSSTSPASRGNMVKEAGLDGKNVVVSSTLKLSDISAGGQSRMVTCAADGSTCVAPNMPLLNQNKMPTPYAGMYCVPTSAGMVFETFQRAGFTFPRDSGLEYSALSTSEDRVLWLGKKMGTNAEGTYGYPEMQVIDALIWSATPGYELNSRTAMTTPADMKKDAQNNGIALMSYGHYGAVNHRTLLSGRQTADMVRNGGHSISINGYRTTASNQIETIYNDPWDETQYARQYETVPLDGAVKYNVPYVSADGKTSNYAVFTYGSGPSFGAEFVDAYYPMLPSSPNRVLPGATAVDPAVTAAQAVVQAAYQKVLNRAAEPAGLAAFTQMVLAGSTQAQIETLLMASDEYKNLHPVVQPPVVQPPVVQQPVIQQPVAATHPTDNLVRALFGSLLKRAPEPAALDYMAQFGNARIGHEIGASIEAFNIYRAMDDRTFVVYLYTNMLFRSPVEWEIAFWAGELAAGRVSRVDAVDGFANSPEFANRSAQF